MQCPRCHNDNIKYMYKLKGEYYCRQCIGFQRVFVNQQRLTKPKCYPAKLVEYHLDFSLSLAQQKISKQLVVNYQNHLHSIILAVCGSGKTEIVFELIQYAISQGERVCFCIPRKELVKELYQRLKQAFFNVDIGVLYGGHIENDSAQLIICTMHQLYRFENQDGFHLMIADEVDAFPFYKNSVLNQIFERCCLKNYVKMSATVCLDDIKDEQLLIMNRRYHGYDLPIPRIILCPVFLQMIILIFLLYKMQKKTLIYVPKVSLVHKVQTILNYTSFNSRGVSSKHKHNQEVIQQLKEGKIDCVVTTTLLERGITIEDVQVIVYQGEHALFDEKTLIQIAGRVGRKPNHPTGKVYILTSEKTKDISNCVRTLKKLNA